jgi:hypothetical protein
MSAPLQIPQTRLITDEERKELLALYTEAEALASRGKEGLPEASLGHTVMFGGTGAGKSKHLAFLDKPKKQAR